RRTGPPGWVAAPGYLHSPPAADTPARRTAGCRATVVADAMMLTCPWCLCPCSGLCHDLAACCQFVILNLNICVCPIELHEELLRLHAAGPELVRHDDQVHPFI